MRKTLVVLCRGKSLDKASFLLNQAFRMRDLGSKIDVCYVNSFRELLKNEHVIELSKIASESYQYINNDPINIEAKECYQGLGITTIQSNKKKTDLDSPAFLNNELSLKLGVSTSFIEEETERKSYSLVSSGLGCVVYFASSKDYESVIIAGLDFFESEYAHYHINTGKKKVREYQPKKGKIAKKQFIDAVRRLNDVKFTIYTYADLNTPDEIKNLNVF